MKTTAALATTPQAPLTITELDLDAVAPGELQVRMVASGVCHTDAIVRDQWYPTPLPAVLGHEGAGIVEAVGPGVTGFAPGDRVLLSFSSCGRCARCVSGEASYCEHMFERNFSGRRADGSAAFSLDGTPVSSHFFGQSSFAAVSNVSASCAVKVDPEAPLEILAPLGCGIQTGAGAVFNALKPELGATLAVFGAGAVGLSAVMAAKVADCSVIIAVDRNAQRLELAKELGATHTVLAETGNPAEEVRRITGRGVQYAVETTGVPSVFTTMTESLAPRGVTGVLGAAALGTSASLDIGSLLPMGITIKMITEGDSNPSVFIPQLIELHRSGRFPFDRLIKTYSFDRINEAFEDSANGTTLKPVVVFT